MGFLKSLIGRVYGGAKSTVAGVVVAAGAGTAAAVTGAAAKFSENPQFVDWGPYAMAAAAAAVPAIVGTFSKDPEDAAPSLSETALKAGQAIDAAVTDYATKKTDEVIAKIQEQLAVLPAK